MRLFPASLRVLRPSLRTAGERARNFNQASGGSALVEFALILTIMVMVYIGLVDYALMTQQAMQVTEAAAAGASYGAIPGNQKDFTGMQNAAKNTAVGISGFAVTATDLFTCTPGGATVTSSTTCTGYGTPIEYVSVQTSATVSPLLSYTGMTSINLTGSAKFRVPWTP